jgi:hypothetical protein
MTPLPEQNESLWVLAVSPAIWVAHFMLCYLSAAIWCAKIVGRDGSLSTVQMAIAVYTVLALIAIGLIGRVGLRRHRLDSATVPHDFDTPEDRHRFLGFATLLLSALSAVATLYVALAAIFIGSCY